MSGFKRKIFYLSGFDPRGARFYQQFHAEQAALYASRSGRTVTVGDRKRADEGNSRWVIRDETGGAESDLTFLGWDDVIRGHWVRNPLRLLWGACASTLAFSRAMDWRHGRTFPKGSLIAFYYPALSTVVLPLLLVAALWLLFGPWIGIAAGLALTAFIVRRIKSLWMLRFIIFNDRLSSDVPDPLIEARLGRMADAIQAELDKPWDEILFVTHSNGSVLSVPVMARLLERNGGRMPANFALVTLGSCIPLVGCRKDANRFRAQLETLATGNFLWLDIGSLTDGASIPLVDPCISCATGQRPELVQLSPRWFRYCDPATYDARRRNKYEVHFEYLRSFDRISPLDYLRLTSIGEQVRASIAAFRAENAA